MTTQVTRIFNLETFKDFNNLLSEGHSVTSHFGRRIIHFDNPKGKISYFELIKDFIQFFPIKWNLLQGRVLQERVLIRKYFQTNEITLEERIHGIKALCKLNLIAIKYNSTACKIHDFAVFLFDNSLKKDMEYLRGMDAFDCLRTIGPFYNESDCCKYLNENGLQLTWETEIVKDYNEIAERYYYYLRPDVRTLKEMARTKMIRDFKKIVITKIARTKIVRDEMVRDEMVRDLTRDDMVGDLVRDEMIRDEIVRYEIARDLARDDMVRDLVRDFKKTARNEMVITDGYVDFSNVETCKNEKLTGPFCKKIIYTINAAWDFIGISSRDNFIKIDHSEDSDEGIEQDSLSQIPDTIIPIPGAITSEEDSDSEDSDSEDIGYEDGLSRIPDISSIPEDKKDFNCSYSI